MSEATVSEVPLNARMNHTYVTYTVPTNVDNTKYVLKPYLPANTLFEVDKRQDALLVPNAALRWQPSPAQIAPDIRTEYLHTQQVKQAGGAPPSGNDKDSQHRGTVWVLDGQSVRPVKVKIGLSDGSNTEVTA